MRAAAADAIVEQLRALGPPDPLVCDEAGVIDPWRNGPPTPAALANRRFPIFGHHTKLPLPIDWLQDPHDSRSWRYQLHTLTWLRPTIERHAIGRDPEALSVARDVVLDWAEQHVGGRRERGGDGGEQPEISEFAWYDMAAGLRAPYIAYVLRAGLHEGVLDNDVARLLIDAAERHGAELADSDNYAAKNNHGLYQDEGLYLLAHQLPALPLADGWAELAVGRLRSTLRSTLSFDEGAHLEHSTAYHFAITNLVGRLAATVEGVPELGELLDRLRRTAAWQVTPAGRLVQLGDTDDVPAPAWARDAAAHLRGLHALYDAGIAFVRTGNSYLAVSAAYHGPAHKQADDTGFVLVENGQVLLGDAGRWGYYEREPDRLYARSNCAHNVLTVDDQDLDWRAADPYGSGLIAAGEGDGWYAIVVANPLLAAQGVTHRRWFLYRPAHRLIVVDHVDADEPHEYSRYFHFGPGLEAEMIDGAVVAHGDDLTATLTDCSKVTTSIALGRGRDTPDRLGWTYPADRERTPIWTVVSRCRATSATLVAAASIAPTNMDFARVSATSSKVRLDIRSSEDSTAVKTLVARLHHRHAGLSVELVE